MNTLISTNLTQIKALMKSYGIVSAYLFGSAATDSMVEINDVDFLIRFDPELTYTEYGNNYFELMYALQDLLHKDVELVAEDTISNPYLLQKINSQKIAVV